MTQFLDKLRTKVFLRLPQNNQILQFLQMLWTIVKRGSAANESRQSILPNTTKPAVALPDDNMEQDIVEKVEHVQPAPLDAGSPPIIRCCEALGQRDQELAQRGGTSTRWCDIVDYPDLAFLLEKESQKRKSLVILPVQKSVSRGREKEMESLLHPRKLRRGDGPNLNVGARALGETGVEQREECFHSWTGQRSRVCAEESGG